MRVLKYHFLNIRGDEHSLDYVFEQRKITDNIEKLIFTSKMFHILQDNISKVKYSYKQ